MSKFIGRLVNLGIGKETNRGEGVAPDFWVPKSSENLADKVQKARSKLSYGNINIEGNVAPITLKWAEGDIELDVLMNSFGLILLNLLGSVNTGVPGGDGTWAHTFSIDSNSNQHNSLSFIIKGPDRDLLFKLGMINSCVIEIIPEDVVKATINVIAKKSEADTNVVSYKRESKFVGRHLVFKIAALTSDLDDADPIPLKSLRLTINKNVVRDHVLGTVSAVDNLNLGFELFGDIELNLESDVYRDYMLNGNYKAVRIQLLSDEVIGSGSETPELLIDLSRVDFSEWEPLRPNDEIAKQTIQFRALSDLSNNNVINTVTLVNTYTAY